MQSRTSRIISEFAAGIDLDKILKFHRLTFEEAQEILNTREARRQIAARRKVAAIHTHLVAHRFSSYAVHRLCELLSDAKADLRLKGAVAVLNIVGLSRFKQLMAKEVKSAARYRHGLPVEPTPEDAELLKALAIVVAQQRKRPCGSRPAQGVANVSGVPSEKHAPRGPSPAGHGTRTVVPGKFAAPPAQLSDKAH